MLDLSKVHMLVFEKSQSLLAITEKSAGMFLDIVCRGPSISRSHRLYVIIFIYVLLLFRVHILDLSKVHI